jgi:Peptidase M1 N-terminal domain
MNVNAFADNITLHTKNLTIATDSIKLYEMQGNSTVDELEASEKEMSESEKKIRKFQFVDKHDYLIIYPANILSKLRKYVVKIPFEGDLDTSLLGYYRSSYYDKKAGKKM